MNIFFFKKGTIRMNITIYDRYDIMIMEDENGIPIVIKNKFSNIIYSKLTDDLFLEYCKWKYKNL